jgi:hypothetical protein
VDRDTLFPPGLPFSLLITRTNNFSLISHFSTTEFSTSCKRIFCLEDFFSNETIRQNSDVLVVDPGFLSKKTGPGGFSPPFLKTPPPPPAVCPLPKGHRGPPVDIWILQTNFTLIKSKIFILAKDLKHILQVPRKEVCLKRLLHSFYKRILLYVLRSRARHF